MESSSGWFDKLTESEITKNIFSGTVDGIAGKFLADIPSTKRVIRYIPTFGPAAKVEGWVPRNGVIAAKAISKIAGPTATILTGVDVYQDFHKYSGSNRYYASLLSVTGTVVVGGAAAVITAAGAPVWTTVGAGAILGVGVSYGINKIKRTLFGH